MAGLAVITLWARLTRSAVHERCDVEGEQREVAQVHRVRDTLPSLGKDERRDFAMKIPGPESRELASVAFLRGHCSTAS